MTEKRHQHAGTGVPRRRKGGEPRPFSSTSVGSHARRLSLLERVRVGEELALERAKAKPAKWATLEKQYRIPERTLRRIHQAHTRQSAIQDDMSGLQVLDETLMLNRQSIEQLSDLVVTATMGSEQVRASRLLSKALYARVALLVGIGVLPRSFPRADPIEAMSTAITKFIEKLEQHQIPPEIIAEFLRSVNETEPVVNGSGSHDVQTHQS